MPVTVLLLSELSMQYWTLHNDIRSARDRSDLPSESFRRMHEFRVTVFKHFVRLGSVVPVQVVYTDHEREQNLITKYTVS